MSSIGSARAAFAGTPDFAVAHLEALIAAGVQIDRVFTQPDRRAGRGRTLTPSPVKALATGHGIRVVQPTVLDRKATETIDGEPPDILIVVAYGLLLPGWLLEWPRAGCLNVHASLLPRWRGASPIQQAILAGDDATGVSLMRMARGLDAGPVFAQATTPIAPNDTGGSLHDRLAGLGAALLIDTLPGILTGELEPTPQDAAGITYAPKIGKRDARIDWSRPAAAIERQVRAYNPWPVAESRTSDGMRLRIFEARAVDAESDRPVGTIVDRGRREIAVATGDGLLELTAVQAPGGRVISAGAFLAANDLTGGRFVGPD